MTATILEEQEKEEEQQQEEQYTWLLGCDYVKHIIALYWKNNMMKSISNMDNMSDRISGILEEEGYESELEHSVGLGGELAREV